MGRDGERLTRLGELGMVQVRRSNKQSHLSRFVSHSGNGKSGLASSG